VLNGISAIENLCLNALASERKKREKSGTNTRQVYPVFFVANHILQSLTFTTLMEKVRRKSANTSMRVSGKERTLNRQNARLCARTAIEFITGMKKRERKLSDLPEHFTIANKIVDRARRGLPQDRWMRGDHEMLALVKAYIQLQNACINMHQDMIQRGSDAMDIGESR
jgi:hypothetical protein